jgi:hypothetical protein
MCKTVYIYDASRHGSYLGGATTVPLPLEKIFTTRFTLLNSYTNTRSTIKENFFFGSVLRLNIPIVLWFCSVVISVS